MTILKPIAKLFQKIIASNKDKSLARPKNWRNTLSENISKFYNQHQVQRDRTRITEFRKGILDEISACKDLNQLLSIFDKFTKDIQANHKEYDLIPEDLKELKKDLVFLQFLLGSAKSNKEGNFVATDKKHAPAIALIEECAAIINQVEDPLQKLSLKDKDKALADAREKLFKAKVILSETSDPKEVEQRLEGIQAKFNRFEQKILFQGINEEIVLRNAAANAELACRSRDKQKLNIAIATYGKVFSQLDQALASNPSPSLQIAVDGKQFHILTHKIDYMVRGFEFSPNTRKNTTNLQSSYELLDSDIKLLADRHKRLKNNLESRERKNNIDIKELKEILETLNSPTNSSMPSAGAAGKLSSSKFTPAQWQRIHALSKTIKGTQEIDEENILSKRNLLRRKIETELERLDGENAVNQNESNKIEENYQNTEKQAKEGLAKIEASLAEINNRRNLSVDDGLDFDAESERLESDRNASRSISQYEEQSRKTERENKKNQRQTRFPSSSHRSSSTPSIASSTNNSDRNDRERSYDSEHQQQYRHPYSPTASTVSPTSSRNRSRRSSADSSFSAGSRNGVSGYIDVEFSRTAASPRNGNITVSPAAISSTTPAFNNTSRHTPINYDLAKTSEDDQMFFQRMLNVGGKKTTQLTSPPEADAIWVAFTQKMQQHTENVHIPSRDKNPDKSNNGNFNSSKLEIGIPESFNLKHGLWQSIEYKKLPNKAFSLSPAGPVQSSVTFRLQPPTEPNKPQSLRVDVGQPPVGIQSLTAALEGVHTYSRFLGPVGHNVADQKAKVTINDMDPVDAVKTYIGLKQSGIKNVIIGNEPEVKQFFVDKLEKDIVEVNAMFHNLNNPDKAQQRKAYETLFNLYYEAQAAIGHSPHSSHDRPRHR